MSTAEEVDELDGLTLRILIKNEGSVIYDHLIGVPQRSRATAARELMALGLAYRRILANEPGLTTQAGAEPRPQAQLDKPKTQRKQPDSEPQIKGDQNVSAEGLVGMFGTMLNGLST